jgi:cell pole-organizing protein PopZ
MSKEQDAEQEPSIEEILDSIRQIISDDEDDEETTAPAEDDFIEEDVIEHLIEENTPEEEFTLPNELIKDDAESTDFASFLKEEESEEQDDEILELTQVVDTPDPEENIEIALQEAVKKADPAPVEEEPDPMPEAPQKEKAAEEIEIATKPSKPSAPMQDDELLNTIIAGESEKLAKDAFAQLAQRAAVDKSGNITVEDIVRQEMRPILRAWVDKHLPKMMERLLQEELDKIAKRAMEE